MHSTATTVFVSVLCLTLALATAVGAGEASRSLPFIRGDANGDGNVDPGDAMEIIAAIRGETTLGCLDAADANSDSDITWADAVYILNYSLNGGPGPLAPFPECGRPLAAALGCRSYPVCEFAVDRPAQTEAEWWEIVESKEGPWVRSLADWTALLADPDRNPLTGVDPSIVERFSASLVFKNDALSSANFRVLLEAMSFEEATAAFQPFGIGDAFAAEHVGYTCLSPGDCFVDDDYICSSNC